jgi:hypothetical protein
MFFLPNRLIEQNIRENLSRETKLLEIHQKNELNNLKQANEREKQELQKKLRYIIDIYSYFKLFI